MSYFVRNLWATELKVDTPEEIKRARKDDGTFEKDDPATPDVNEAWTDGKGPAKKTKKKAKK